ncbi:SDR family oxidoreductase [Corynebacterium guangdongense]|uniref:Uncharacterized protein YbjT (DUF2867 family) n=1 Tax=Corynebacterium guangdongense TaxID=1783348 RepID=A0ABU1ZXE4_9CORY|nr:SDR family oxidoreductase [Corynebacterium guangdongense]MDR7329612.1 uncharacterized protein YbjT (DUF2867 family) [Corynebacterium guangdongense]WJZ18177.1 NmrA-like family protein [Corynebacterium guangdongense]
MNSTTGYRAHHPARRVLVTGATGYVGGRLIPELLNAGFTVRATSRRLESMRRFDWFDSVEAVEADLTRPEDLAALMADVDVAYYLVHSMGAGVVDFERTEAFVADNVATAAAAAGVGQLVYLSGLHPDREPAELSKHMRSRERVARRLLAGEVPTLVFRAGVIIGSGSASFEIIRHLTDRLPVMTAPNWIDNDIEPISVRDVLYYLVAAADLPSPVNDAVDIGGGHVYQFKELLTLYGRELGLERRIVGLRLPRFANAASGLWIGLVTPVPVKLAIPLAQSMAEDAVTADHRVAEIIPDPPGGLADYPTAVRRALDRQRDDVIPTNWRGAWGGSVIPEQSLPTDPEWAGRTVFTDERSGEIDAPVEDVFAVVEGIGGDSGWYSVPLLWTVRGVIDKLLGGPGLGGRRDARRLAVGDRLDWWRVEAIEPPNRLILRAEMNVGGTAWLVFDVVEGEETGTSRYTQTAVDVPNGLLGRAYWIALLPFHALIFPVMRDNILRAARARREARRS